jgi:hypothetical protein
MIDKNTISKQEMERLDARDYACIWVVSVATAILWIVCIAAVVKMVRGW